jgi:UDP-N-acetylglucosamine--N-acetylmuramyl-(pentapeptide) pyrophosphoryl-undecaprenol N-acetylglucosamine transferase
MRVIMSGGGTAGHVFPAIAVARRLAEAGHDVRFIGSSDGQEATLVPAAGFPFSPVRVISAQTRLALRSVKAVFMALLAARDVRPMVRASDVVVGIGGYASAPAIIAARRTRTPVVLIEPNSVPGLVNRIAARWASAVATTFGSTQSHLPVGTRVVRTGDPIRREIAEVASALGDHRAQALRAFELDPDRMTVTVLGGSQGARRLDQLIDAAIDGLRDRGDLQMLVAAGPAHVDEVAAAAGAAQPLLVRVVGFIDRMDLALALSDLAVARSGAGTVSELTACAIPSILVPYPHATDDHQQANARELERAGAAEVMLEPSLTGSALAARIAGLIDDAPRRASMAAAARRWSSPDADVRVAELVAEVAA